MNFDLFCGRVSGRGSSSLPAAASSPFPSLRSGTRAWRLATSAFARHRLATATAATAATAARTASTSTLERYFTITTTMMLTETEAEKEKKAITISISTVSP